MIGTPNLIKPYSKGPYNVTNDQEQWIRISEGCPNKCEFCRESFENGVEPIYYNIPDIIRNKVKILDMNLLYKPLALEILNTLGAKRVNNHVVHYELVCGIDYRYLTQELATALHDNRFDNIRIAWDRKFSDQVKIKNAIKMLMNAGYKPNKLTIFIICNWRITYLENIRKMDLCKVWNVKISDCYFDNQLPPNITPRFWTSDELKDFRRKVRKHNQLVGFKLDPEELKNTRRNNGIDV